MKKIFYIFAISTIVFFSSCGSKEGRTYFDIKSDYKEFVNSEEFDIFLLDKQAQNISEDLKSFISDYPESEYYEEILDLSNKFDKETTDKLYQNFINKYQKFKVDTFNQYEVKLTKITELNNEADYILLKSESTNYNSNIKAIINEIGVERRKTISEEANYKVLADKFKEDYTLKQANAESEAIKLFLYKYTNCVKTKELNDRRQDLSYVKFKIYAEGNPKNIKQLNAIIDTCKLYKVEISAEKYIEKCEQGLKTLEDSRKAVFKKEWLGQKDSLIIAMEKEAKSFLNKNVHELCKKIISVKIIDKETNDFNTKSTYIYKYEIQSKCGFGCQKICKTQIKVIGTLFGDESTGVLIETEAELISDKKMK